MTSEGNLGGGECLRSGRRATQMGARQKAIAGDFRVELGFQGSQWYRSFCLRFSDGDYYDLSHVQSEKVGTGYKRSGRKKLYHSNFSCRDG